MVTSPFFPANVVVECTLFRSCMEQIRDVFILRIAKCSRVRGAERVQRCGREPGGTAGESASLRDDDGGGRQ